MQAVVGRNKGRAEDMYSSIVAFRRALVPRILKSRQPRLAASWLRMMVRTRSSRVLWPMTHTWYVIRNRSRTAADRSRQVKHRKRTTPEQLAVLEKAFLEATKPTASARKTIADMIGMTPRSVQVWFQNRYV